MPMIGNRIREVRQNRGLTLEQVAAETGLSMSFLSMLERDKVSISVDNLEKLANYYQVHMVHFFRSVDASPVLITRREEIVNGRSNEFLARRLQKRLRHRTLIVQINRKDTHLSLLREIGDQIG